MDVYELSKFLFEFPGIFKDLMEFDWIWQNVDLFFYLIGGNVAELMEFFLIFHGCGVLF